MKYSVVVNLTNWQNESKSQRRHSDRLIINRCSKSH